MGFQKSKNVYVAYKNGKYISTYSVNRHGKYAKLLWKISEESGCSYKQYFKFKDDTCILYYYNKKYNVYHEILIDKDDYDKCKDYFWSTDHDKNNKFYVMTYMERHKELRLHRYLIDTPIGLVVDHINGNTLDNRKNNLRNVTNQINSKNSDTFRSEKNVIVGVYKSGNNYVANWNYNKKKYSKKYNITTYGNNKAKILAVKHRLLAEEVTPGYLRYEKSKLSNEEKKYIRKNKLILPY